MNLSLYFIFFNCSTTPSSIFPVNRTFFSIFAQMSFIVLSHCAGTAVYCTLIIIFWEARSKKKLKKHSRNTKNLKYNGKWMKLSKSQTIIGRFFPIFRLKWKKYSWFEFIRTTVESLLNNKKCTNFRDS